MKVYIVEYPNGGGLDFLTDENISKLPEVILRVEVDVVACIVREWERTRDEYAGLQKTLALHAGTLGSRW